MADRIRRGRVTAAALAALTVIGGLALSPTRAAADPGSVADAYVTDPMNAAALLLVPGEQLVRTGVFNGNQGLSFVAYSRRHDGIPLFGPGDVVVMTDGRQVLASDRGLDHPISLATTTPTVPARRAGQIARRFARQSATGVTVAPARLMISAANPESELAWIVDAAGTLASGDPYAHHISVNAITGRPVDLGSFIEDGTGTGFYSGPVAIDTSPTASGFSMVDPTRTGLSCGASVPGPIGPVAPLTGPVDAWGDGSPTDLATACVDTMYGAQQEWDMLRDWFSRNGIDNDGHSPSIRIGSEPGGAHFVADTLADGLSWDTVFGRSVDLQRPLTSLDVVAHEFGHAVFATDPGGAAEPIVVQEPDGREISVGENSGLNEGTGDIIAMLTVAHTGNPREPLTYRIGDLVNLAGTGPIRIMYHPSLVSSPRFGPQPDCYSAAIARTEAHAAAGPLNHWFYLLAEGSDPAGRERSPSCDGSTITGLGVRAAGQIFYDGLLFKTSTWDYLKARTATLLAAKYLYRDTGTCAEFNTVKAAWNAVNVPGRPGDPTCEVLPVTGTRGVSALLPLGGGAILVGVLFLLLSRGRLKRHQPAR